MKKLIALPVPPEHGDRYVAIRDSKRNPVRAALLAHHAAIIARYDLLRLHAAAGTLAAIVPSPLIALSDDLRACYGGKTKALTALKDAIRDAQIERQLKYCPYCGTTTNDTTDHYLPAVRFPEFAVHPLNLVPCCFRCNSIKDDDWLDALGRRQYLQAYLDDLPDENFLEVDLIARPGFTAPGARFRIVQGTIPAAAWGLIERHFERLHLIGRYNNGANDEIGVMLVGAADFLFAGGVDVRMFLAAQAASAAASWGRNHWRAVLLSALSQHADLEPWVAAVPVAAAA